MATFPLCNDQDESLFHIFGDCVKVGPLWIPFIHISRIDSFFELFCNICPIKLSEVAIRFIFSIHLFYAHFQHNFSIFITPFCFLKD